MHTSDYIPLVRVMESSDYGEQMVCSGDIILRCVAEREKTAESFFNFLKV